MENKSMPLVCLNGKETESVKCSVLMDGVWTKSDDFVAILSKSNGDTGIYYNTDALTLGMAIKMISKAYVEAFNELPVDEQAKVTAILGDEFTLGATKNEQD